MVAACIFAMISFCHLLLNIALRKPHFLCFEILSLLAIVSVWYLYISQATFFSFSEEQYTLDIGVLLLLQAF